MSAAALRVVPIPASPAPRQVLRLVPQPRPTWHQLTLQLSLDDAPTPPLADDVSGDDSMPDVEMWVRQFVSGMIDVLAGNRPATQLSRWVDPPVLQALTSRAAGRSARATPSHAMVTSVRAQRPRADAVEACAVVRLGARHRAVALRLRSDAGRWKCAAVQVL